MMWCQVVGDKWEKKQLKTMQDKGIWECVQF